MGLSNNYILFESKINVVDLGLSNILSEHFEKNQVMTVLDIIKLCPKLCILAFKKAVLNET